MVLYWRCERCGAGSVPVRYGKVQIRYGLCRSVQYGTGTGTVQYEAEYRVAIRLVFLFACWGKVVVYERALSVEFDLFILKLDNYVYNVIGVFQAARSRRLDSVWLGAIMLELCGLGNWRANVHFRCLPCRYGETSWTRSGLAWLGRRLGVTVCA